ncbi:hypothetical protein SAMN04488564_1232 [Lentzea waywayandensis]|uniref:Uncharacterized protein n=1 Tax=Lentzea waywayandensis TaxID=84724 RepID=A0A1I6FJA4_9PSEU|nr:hypothetical protein [Lentzea waywayandensis]SFR29887.1 hypothetical protein SAMN04488564_1232 [Lentzea waywayandensis]
MTDSTHLISDLSKRDVALLRAVAAGRAQMSQSCEPDLFIDGMASCDQTAARCLAHAGLIEPVLPAVAGSLTRARLTLLGASVLAQQAMPA